MRVLLLLLFWGMFFFLQVVHPSKPDKCLLPIPDNHSDFIFALGCLYILAHINFYWIELLRLFGSLLKQKGLSGDRHPQPGRSPDGWQLRALLKFKLTPPETNDP